MAANELAPQQRIGAFSNNARFYAPAHLTRQLQSIATTEPLAVIIDVDALDRSTFARGDRVMTLALDALSHVSVHVVLVSRCAMERAVMLQRSVPRSWCFETERAVHEIRERISGVQLIAVSDDLQLLAALGADDRGIALACANHASNVVTTGEITVRAVLWWLVDRRAKAGMAARP